MKVKLGTVPGFLLFLVVLSDFARTVLSFDKKCPSLKLVSGRSRYSWRGRSVRFNCMRGFQLVGVKYATCMNGKWDADVPICVKYGCRAPSTTHVNGQFIESYRGAVVKIVCNPGYTLMGSPSVYCNGFRWNETFPVCRVTNLDPALACDFEDVNLCGWSQDPMHDFDWKRQNGSSGEGLTDHVLLGNSTGYHMYMEGTSSRVENGAARLYSPVYPSSLSNGTCFKFWYNLHGSTAGYLKVYVKPEGVDLTNLIPSFWMNGDQGLSWLPGFFRIEPTESLFQIVIEGIRGPEPDSRTAFDNVQLISGDECGVLENMTTSTEPSTSAVTGEEEGYSCKNRCNGRETDDEAPQCDCRETCVRDDNCCPDYYFYCQATVSPTTQTEPESTTSSTVIKSTTPVSALENKTIVQPPIATDYNNQSNEIDPKNPIFNPPPKSTFNRTLNEIPGVVKTTTTTSTTQKPKVEERNSTRERNETVVPKMPNVAVDRNRWKVPTNRTGAPKVPEKAKNVNVTSSTTTPAPHRPPKPQKPNNMKLTYAEMPSSPVRSNEPRFPKGKSKEPSEKELPQAIKIDKKEESSPGSFRGIIEVGGTSLALLVIVALGVLWYWRSRNRKIERDNMVEDSDSIVCQMDQTNLSSETHSLVCIRPGGLQQSH